MYSQGDDSYQRLSQDHRLRMTIDGEPVCEIDIRASYLTIYHAHFGVPLDAERDPYELPGLPADTRGVIKLWFVATFGNNGHLDRWPREIARKYREEHGRPIGKRYPVKRIRENALKLYPLLEKWGREDFGWPDLMFTESQAMIGAISELMSLSIPSLSVHDSLIVPVAKQEIAEQTLSKHYLKATGTVPGLKVNWPLPDNLPNEGRSNYTDDPFGFGDTEDKNIDDWDSPAEPCKYIDAFGFGDTEDKNIDDWDSPAEPCKYIDAFGFGDTATEDKNIDDWDSPAEPCKYIDAFGFGDTETEDKNIDDRDSPAERGVDDESSAARKRTDNNDADYDGSYF
jgi:hypothetical protein